MAPHAEGPFGDTSGYTPSADSIRELRAALRLHHRQVVSEKTWLTEGAQSIDSHDREEKREPWILQLSLDDLNEIEDAVQHFEGTKLPLNKLQARHFPLPKLSLKIRKRSIALSDRQPYFLIRGLKPQWFSKCKNVIIYTGIASHVGSKRAMAAGDPNVLHHITNLDILPETENTIYRGPANRTMPIPFHNDYGDILSLYTLSRPASGGDFYLADIHDIVSRISETRPDLVETLRKSWIVVNPQADGDYDARPLLFTLPSGQMAIQASRSRLFGTIARPRPPSLPPLSAQQVEALNALHAAGQEVARCFEFRSGDMIFFNNLRMMHARDGFVDGNELENTTKRYLLRLILRDERNRINWEPPKEMRPTWKTLYGHEDEEEILAVRPELFSFKAGH
ncbi:Clavaminate synthase-like protein [Rhizodiscina lignyota]|uniref:Clavaminate synthase-like protein n=1 Tax=Rhizodiscina lignyota TaxID=1504668 RepID=A0A9P4IK63_9PEZI|nr:Clavaminate synthase-like protein [Rhizodiscina lignyota]